MGLGSWYYEDISKVPREIGMCRLRFNYPQRMLFPDLDMVATSQLPTATGMGNVVVRAASTTGSVTTASTCMQGFQTKHAGKIDLEKHSDHSERPCVISSPCLRLGCGLLCLLLTMGSLPSRTESWRRCSLPPCCDRETS